MTPMVVGFFIVVFVVAAAFFLSMIMSGKPESR